MILKGNMVSSLSSVKTVVNIIFEGMAKVLLWNLDKLTLARVQNRYSSFNTLPRCIILLTPYLGRPIGAELT